MIFCKFGSCGVGIQGTSTSQHENCNAVELLNSHLNVRRQPARAVHRKLVLDRGQFETKSDAVSKTPSAITAHQPD
jgi:hypothetical protein